MSRRFFGGVAVALTALLVGAHVRADETRLDATAKARPDVDPVDALATSISSEEQLALDKLLAGLPRTGPEIRERFGARAARPLLAVARTHRDPDVRFRAKALVHAIVFRYYLDHAPECGYLGVKWTMNGTHAHFFSAHVVEAKPGSPAWDGGLREGDELVAFGGVAFDGQDDFIDRVQTAAPGSVVVATVERGGRELTLAVTMGTRVGDDGKPYVPYPHWKREVAARRLARWVDAATAH